MTISLGSGQAGYGVHLDMMDQMAGQLHQVSTDLAGATSAYTAPVCYAKSDFGEFGVDDAWQAFDSAWAQEIALAQKAVDELVQQVTQTTANYRTAEANVASSVTGAVR
ncbi:hypothetical protein ACFC1R_15320 [Kitasatospora sp. NPDC056138]|uniref:hypothetical protein n=1 Tax=Kitasatospora sp. NPDC056138 TaxID=3345724 RepID=UPI0035DF77A8